MAVARLILTSCERTEIIWEDAWEIAVSVALNGLDPESDTAGELHERLRAVEPILQRRYASRVAAQRRERESASARERRIALE